MRKALTIFYIIPLLSFAQTRIDSIYIITTDYAKELSKTPNYFTSELYQFNSKEKFKLISFNDNEDSVYLENASNTVILIPKNDLYRGFWEYKRMLELQKKYGASNWEIIFSGNVKIGWSKELCQISWGPPTTINKTTTRYSVSEQWVYGSSYLYFENGKLTTIQD